MGFKCLMCARICIRRLANIIKKVRKPVVKKLINIGSKLKNLGGIVLLFLITILNYELLKIETLV